MPKPKIGRVSVKTKPSKPPQIQPKKGKGK
jgi:hypothetical protein